MKTPITFALTSALASLLASVAGIQERRWWDDEVSFADAAAMADIDGRELHFLCDLYDGERHIAQGMIKRKAVERVSYLARTAAQSLIN